MAPSPFAGHITPCIIPYTPDDEIDEGALAKYVEYLTAIDGMNGIVFNPHAGEVYSQTHAERQRIVEIGLKTVNRRKLVLAGVAPTPDTVKAAVSQARDFAAMGVDGLLLMAPHWFAFGVNQLPHLAVDYVKRVADAVDIPIMVYQLGSWTGAHYSLETLTKMCEIDKVRGVKIVTIGHRDVVEFDDILRALHALPQGVAVLTGNDNVLMYNFIAGADGSLVGLHNVYPELIIDMFRAVQAGDLKRAMELHRRQDPVQRVLFSDPPMMYRTRYKYAAYLQGKVPSYRLKPPLPTVTDAAEQQRIRKALLEAGMLSA